MLGMHFTLMESCKSFTTMRSLQVLCHKCCGEEKKWNGVSDTADIARLLATIVILFSFLGEGKRVTIKAAEQLQ